MPTHFETLSIYGVPAWESESCKVLFQLFDQFLGVDMLWKSLQRFLDKLVTVLKVANLHNRDGTQMSLIFTQLLTNIQAV